MILNQCEAWVTCENRRLPEYSMKSEGDGKTISCYIPSRVGKAFSLHWRTSGSSSMNHCELYMDGIHVGSYSANDSMSAVRTGPSTRQPLRSAELLTTDDDTALHRLGHSDLWTIKVSFWNASITPGWSGKRKYSRFDALQSVQPIHERSKKAGGHCITLGTKEVAPPRSRYQNTFELIGLEPQVVLLFRYRPLAILQAERIAPRSLQLYVSVDDVKANVRRSEAKDKRRQQRKPSRPNRLLAASNREELSDDKAHLSALKSRLQKIQSQIAEVENEVRKKRKRSEDTSSPSRPIGRQVKNKQSASIKRRMSAQDVIDLTLSD
ncbi:hypothetical protein C8Q80DRAFT_362358 [Daedaleopsis nitida]|nr:hypothetical protein C8Q80DRAFT_362358 [Daedaleopsis nitida]